MTQSGKTNEYHYHTKLESKISNISEHYLSFIDTQVFSSLLLVICLLASIVLFNSSYTSQLYQTLIHTEFGLFYGDYTFHTYLKWFVDNVLLVLFFFALGLEVKRELTLGALSDYRKSTLVILSTLSGIILPIIYFLILNYHHADYVQGWAIPIATDTALAIGVLYLFKRYVPKHLFTFMASVAVLDDIVSVIIISVFYTKGFSLYYFALANASLFITILFNLSGFRKPYPYLICGFALWYCVVQAGIHPTITGILLAFTIPARPKKKPHKAVKRIKGLLDEFEENYDKEAHILIEDNPHEILEEVADESIDAMAPLKRWESKLETPVLIFILPLFILTNGGFHLDASSLISAFKSPVFWGIYIGLVIFKPLGLWASCFILTRSRYCELPDNMQMKDIALVAGLSGIGYTMSFFISELAFQPPWLINLSKLSIFLASSSSFILVMMYYFIKCRTKV